MSIPQSIVLLDGWRRAGLAFVIGAASALAQAPFHALPVLFVTLPVLILLIDGAVSRSTSGRVRRARPAFAVGWWFGFGYFLAGLWWIGMAFLVEAEQFAWMLPFAATAMPAGLALFTGLAAAVARLVWPEGWRRVLVFALAFGAADWLRGHVLTGFPWNSFGAALAATDVTMQAASLVGLHGLAFLCLLIAAAPVVLADGRERRGGGLAFFGVAVVLMVAIVGFGVARLSTATTATVADVRLRIMQPVLGQVERFRPEVARELLTRYFELSNRSTGDDRRGIADVTHLIWPESSFPYLLTEQPGVLSAIAAFLPEGTTLITGADRAEPPAAGETRRRVFNSLYVIGHDGAVLGSYDKAHLVPFGEYLPFQDVLEAAGIRQLTGLPGGFAAGPGLATLPVPGAPAFGPLICYEVIFPGKAVNAESRPGWIVNVTNDIWFGDTPGPRQHLHQARLRAVEEGLPVVRAANNGISAVIDAHGRLVASLPLDRVGVLDADLPVALEPTIYSQLGDLLLAAMSILSIVAIGLKKR